MVRAPDALWSPPLGETTNTSDWSLREDQEFARWDYTSHLVRQHVKMDQWEKGQSVARYHHNMKWQDGCFFFFFFFYKCYIFAQAALSFSSENNRNKCHSPGSGDMLCFLRGREAPLCPQPFIQLLPFSEPPYHFEPFSHFWPCHLHTQTALKVAIPHRTPPPPHVLLFN